MTEFLWRTVTPILLGASIALNAMNAFIYGPSVMGYVSIFIASMCGGLLAYRFRHPDLRPPRSRYLHRVEQMTERDFRAWRKGLDRAAADSDGKWISAALDIVGWDRTQMEFSTVDDLMDALAVHIAAGKRRGRR